ncbi:unnamed protein product [Rhodiola kirilowii]
MEEDMGEGIEELPKTIVRIVVKKKLSECSDAGDIDIHKDARTIGFLCRRSRLHPAPVR